ncbi:hypothetical protein EsH8_III_001109 [Colletotrichum jinshuiense]
MDHLSSSSSSTGTTTYTQQSVSTFRQDVPRQTYTTAGTIYNPSSSQPLQPPVRRGRTLKWPPTGSPASELSLFPKSLLAGLPLKAQSLVTTPTSPLPHQIPKYSPLQQNYDRAISPAIDHSRESLNDPDIRSLPSTRIPSYNMNSSQASPVAVAMPASVVSKNLDTDSSDDEDEDSSGENSLKGLTVKSLHNLASYPNPNQKRAQRALLCARPSVTPAIPAGTNMSRTATPSFGAPLESSDIGNDGSHSPGLFRSAKTGPTDVLKLQAELKATRDSTATWRVDGTTPPPGLVNAHSIHGNNQSAAYKSTLATGPGAPRPLTAGPPGHRQYRALAFDTAMKTLNSGLKTVVSSDEPMNGDSRTVPCGIYKNVLHDMAKFSSSATPDLVRAGLSSLLCNSTPDADHYQNSVDSRKVSDIDMEKILEFIKLGPGINESNGDISRCPNSLPASVIPTIPGEDWQDEYPRSDRPIWTPGTCRMTEEELQRRNERINNLFHAGTGELGKSLESIINDADFRQFKRDVGVIGDRRPKVKPEKIEYPPISIQQANDMTDKETAEPFVTMAFSSLLSHVEGGYSHRPFHQWKSPAKDLLDSSAKGRQSVFGN